MPTVDTVVEYYEKALLQDDFAVMSGIMHSLLNMLVFGDEELSKSARRTAQAILVIREAHQTLDL